MSQWRQSLARDSIGVAHVKNEREAASGMKLEM